MALSLRARLALVVGAGFGSLLAAGAVAFYLDLARSYRRDFDHALLDAGRSAAALFRIDQPEFPAAAMGATHVVGELAYGDRTLVAYDRAGRILAVSRRVPDEPWFDDAPLLSPAGRPGTLALRAGRARVVRVDLPDSTAIVVATSTLPLEHRLIRIRQTLLTVLPVILLLGAGLAGWGAGLVLRPIVRVAESAERLGSAVASGATRFDPLPVPPTRDELATLTDAFNHLADRLSAALEHERGAVDRQRRFLAEAAHELRTPVAILRSEAEVTVRGEASVATYGAALERIGDEAERLSRLVADLLLVARQDAEGVGVARDKVFLDDLLHRVLGRARTLPAARDRAFRRGEFEAAPVLGDATLLERALLVLVHNALVHAPGSAVEVSAGTSEAGDRRWAWARVRDFGPGIGPADRERIFERFSRLNPAAPGTGLGLPIARAIAEAHGGTLTLDETTPGAAFTLRLPAAAGA